MERAWVAFACGLNAVVGFWSISTAATPRRPSSFASISPHGPPPTMRTWASVGIMWLSAADRSRSVTARRPRHPASLLLVLFHDWPPKLLLVFDESLGFRRCHGRRPHPETFEAPLDAGRFECITKTFIEAPHD